MTSRSRGGRVATDLRARGGVAVLAALALVAGLEACSDDSEPAQGTGWGSSSGPSSSPATAEDPAPDDDTGDTDASDTEDDMQVRITVGEQQFTATLEVSAAAGDLLAQLPVTVEMTDHGGVEKTGPLPSPLSLDGQPEGTDPDIGDLGYYAPGHDLVLYYGNQSYFPGIVVLGRLDGDAVERIASIEGSVTVVVESA